MSSNPQPISGDSGHRRVLIVPSAGMGHLLPFVSLAANLSDLQIPVSLLVPQPTISSAESLLLTSLPPSLIEDLPLAPLPTSLFPPSSDPFLLRMEAIRRSANLLLPFITSSNPISSLVVDISIASTFIPFAASHNIPCFVLFTSSAAMLALCSVFPSSSPLADREIDIAGVLKIPPSSLPQPLHDPAHFFKAQFVENGKALSQASAILVNTFTALEPVVLSKLNSGDVVPGLPPVITVGPLLRKKPSWVSPAMRWLDEQPRKSVIYVSFGSRTAMSREQVRELGAALEMSERRFLWVMKSRMVDREEDVGEIEEMVGEGYVERIGGRGLVVMEWVEQDAILGHAAVIGFLSHCGWNSMMEAAAAGVRVLAWPRGGDQRVNAAVVVESGVGVWPTEWVWEGEEGVVAAEEIARKVMELFEDGKVGEAAEKMAAEASAAVVEGLSLENWLGMFDRKVLM